VTADSGKHGCWRAVARAVSAQLCPHPKWLRGPPNDYLLKKVMLHLGAEWTSKQNNLKADIILAETGP